MSAIISMIEAMGVDDVDAACVFGELLKDKNSVFRREIEAAMREALADVNGVEGAEMFSEETYNRSYDYDSSEDDEDEDPCGLEVYSYSTEFRVQLQEDVIRALNSGVITSVKTPLGMEPEVDPESNVTRCESEDSVVEEDVSGITVTSAYDDVVAFERQSDEVWEIPKEARGAVSVRPVRRVKRNVGRMIDVNGYGVSRATIDRRFTNRNWDNADYSVRSASYHWKKKLQRKPYRRFPRSLKLIGVDKSCNTFFYPADPADIDVNNNDDWYDVNYGHFGDDALKSWYSQTAEFDDVQVVRVVKELLRDNRIGVYCTEVKYKDAMRPMKVAFAFRKRLCYVVLFFPGTWQGYVRKYVDDVDGADMTNPLCRVERIGNSICSLDPSSYNAKKSARAYTNLRKTLGLKKA